jgi:micrococcal nuclease
MRVLARSLCLVIVGIAFSGAGIAHPADPGLIAGTVARVVDGDTIVVQIKSRSGTMPRDLGTLKSEETVRYLGINTPELGRDNQPPECFAARAQRQNELLTLHQDVTLQTDIQGRDRFGRLLAYVFIGEISQDDLVQERLLSGGFGGVIAIAPNVWKTRRFLDVQRHAIGNKSGLWAECGTPRGIESVTISEIQFIGKDETVTLVNRGSIAVDLSGWKLISLPGQTLTFPRHCLLEAGGRLRVHTGPQAGGSPDCARGDLFWTQSFIWSNDGDTAILQTPQGIVADFFEYRGGHSSTHSGH